MTQDEIIRMAREAGAQVQAEWNMGGLADGFYMEWAEEVALRVAALVAAHEREKRTDHSDDITNLVKAAVIAEREACAKVCEENRWGNLGAGCAAAIRARGNNK